MTFSASYNHSLTIWILPLWHYLTDNLMVIALKNWPLLWLIVTLTRIMTASIALASIRMWSSFSLPTLKALNLGLLPSGILFQMTAFQSFTTLIFSKEMQTAIFPLFFNYILLSFLCDSIPSSGTWCLEWHMMSDTLKKRLFIKIDDSDTKILKIKNVLRNGVYELLCLLKSWSSRVLSPPYWFLPTRMSSQG